MDKCGEKCEVYSRVTGYFRPVANWNKGKKEEFAERKTYKVVGILAALVALAVCAGCGHNAITYGKGFAAETTFNPETYALGVSVRYGNILTVAVRENSEIEVESDGEAGKDSGATGTRDKVCIKIGKQITGYYCDAIKAGATPDQLDKYTAEGISKTETTTEKSSEDKK